MTNERAQELKEWIATELYETDYDGNITLPDYARELIALIDRDTAKKYALAWSATMYCPVCTHVLEINDCFCWFCGQRIQRLESE